MTFLAFVGLLNFLTCAISGWFVLRSRPRSQLALAYGLFCLSVAGWSLSFFYWQLMPTAEHALWPLRWVLFLGMWPNLAFLHFVFVHEGKNHYKRMALYSLVLVNLIFAVLNFAGWLFPTVEARAGLGFWGNITPWFTAYFILWNLECFYAFVELIRAFRGSEGRQREQIRYFLAAMIIGHIGGYSSWPLWYKIYVPPQLNILVSVCIVFLAYAIIKHHLLDINVVIRKTLVYSLVSAALVSAYVGAITLFARIMEVQSLSLSPFSSFLRALGDGIQWIKTTAQASFNYSCVAIALLSIGLGIFVWYQGRRKPANRLWFFMCFSVAMWSFGLGMMGRSPTAAEAHFWQTWFLYGGACFIPTVFLHFVSLVVSHPMRKTLIAAYATSCAEFLLNISGHLATVAPRLPFNFYTVSYPIYSSYAIFFVVVATYAHLLLVKTFFSSEGLLKEQVRYIGVGTLMGFCGGATTFFYVFGIDVFPYGMYAVPLYIVTVSYAIFKHRLMDINVVIRRTLLYSALSAVLACIYVSTIMLLAYVFGVHKGSVSPLSSAMAAVIITLLFNPVRVRIQRFVDRYFFREALDQALLREATSGFVHEIKRPLANISLPAELSLMDLQDLKNKRRSLKDVLPKLEERLQYILNQTADAGNKIEAIREFSNSNGKPSEEVDVIEIIRRSLSAEEPLLRRHQVDLKLDLADHLPVIKGHPKQLQIVISNLIKNSAEAIATLQNGAERTLWITASTAAGKINIQVKDSGPGIKPESLPRLFEPYFTTKGAHGTGMGLYLSRQIIQAHGGSVSTLSEQNKGAIFFIQLPCNGHL